MHTRSHSIPSPTTVAVSDLPSRILRQWFGLAANAVISTCRTQFINHADYKIIDAAAVTKIHSPPSCIRRTDKDNFATGNGKLSKTLLTSKLATWSNSPALVSDTLLSELHAVRDFAF